MEYATQITFREEWFDDRLKYNNKSGIRFLTLTEPEKIWKPDLFFKNEKEGHFHNIIMPNVLLRIHPDGKVLYSIRISLVSVKLCNWASVTESLFTKVNRMANRIDWIGSLSKHAK